MMLQEFKEKKYGNSFVELKKLVKDFQDNEKKKNKYFFLKSRGEQTFEFERLKKEIIW